MNKIHKSQYNESLGTWVAVPEIAKGRGKATGVAKEIPMTPSLPKFAVSALTLALLQVVSVSAYGYSGQNPGDLCTMKNSVLVCGVGTEVPDKLFGTAVGNNVYAGMATAIGNDITVGSKEDYLAAKRKAQQKALNAGEDADNFGKYFEYNPVAKGSFAAGENINVKNHDVVAIGKKITVNTSNTIAIGSNIEKTKENSVFLGNKSGYIEDNSGLENASIASLGNTKDADTAKVKLLEKIDYAGINNTIGVVSVGNSEGTRRIQGVAPGLVSKKSADAINGAQLFAAYDVIDDNKEKIAGNTNNINNNKNNIAGNEKRITKNEADIAKGWNIGKVAASDVASLQPTEGQKIKPGNTVNFADSDTISVALKKDSNDKVAVQFDINPDQVRDKISTKLPIVYTDDNGNIVQRVGDKWYKTSEIEKAKRENTELTGGIDGRKIIASARNPSAAIDVRGEVVKLSNIKDGVISSSSKDAINGSQLFSDRVALAGLLGGGAAALTPDKKQGFTLNAKGKKVPVKTLDGLMLDGDFQAPTFTVNKANGDVYQIGTGAGAKDAVAHNVGDALQNLNTYVNEGITVADNNGHSGALAPTETLKFADGKKTTAKVSKQGNTVTVTVDVNSDAIASDVLTQGPVIYTVKNGSENAPVVKIDNKWYLAKDVTNGEPVAGAQEQAADSINASLRNPNAGATSSGAAYVLNNIADGVAPHDAINKRQFDYAVVYGDSSKPNYAETADHSFVAFKGTPVEVLGNGTTKVDTGTQLRNVASAGDITKKENAGHAVNAGDLHYQVDSLTNNLTKKGLDFAGDTGSVHKDLGETLIVTGDDNIKVAASNGGLQISIKPDPTFAGKVTAEGGIVAGKKNQIKINTDGDGKIHGLTNISIDKLDDGSKGTSVAATEAQLGKVIAKIDSNDKHINERIDEGRVFTGDIGDQVKVGLGEALAVNGGISDESKLSEGNIGVVTKDKGLEIKLGKELKGINSIALTAPESSGGNSGNGTPSPTTDLSNNGIRIKPSAVDGKEVALTDAGLDNGGNKIVNVGDGLIADNSKEAVNGGQLLDQIEAVKNIIGGPVEYNNSSNKYVVKNPDRDGNGNPTGGIGGTGEITIDAAIKSIKDQKETAYVAGKNIDITPDPNKPGTKVIRTADNVEFNSVKIIGNNPDKSVEINGNGINAGDMKVRNVAAGRIAPSSQDAVNGGQLYQVKQDINEMDKRARSGIASAMASAGLPQAYLPGKSMIGAAASNYRGETAIAVGVSTISDNGKWLVKADANANRKDFGVSLGVGYQW